MIKSLKTKVFGITLPSIPLMPPSFDLGSEFVIRDVHVTVQVAVDIIFFKNNSGQRIGERRGPQTLLLYLEKLKAKRVLAS